MSALLEDIGAFDAAAEEAEPRAVTMTPRHRRHFIGLFKQLREGADDLQVIRHPSAISPEVILVDADDWDEGRFNDRSASEGSVIRIKQTGNYHAMSLDLLHEYGHVLLGHTTYRDVWRPLAEIHAEAVAWTVGKRIGVTVERSPHYAAIWKRETVDGVYSDTDRQITSVVNTRREAERLAAVSRQLLFTADSE